MDDDEGHAKGCSMWPSSKKKRRQEVQRDALNASLGDGGRGDVARAFDDAVTPAPDEVCDVLPLARVVPICPVPPANIQLAADEPLKAPPKGIYTPRPSPLTRVPPEPSIGRIRLTHVDFLLGEAMVGAYLQVELGTDIQKSDSWTINGAGKREVHARSCSLRLTEQILPHQTTTAFRTLARVRTLSSTSYPRRATSCSRCSTAAGPSVGP